MLLLCCERPRVCWGRGGKIKDTAGIWKFVVVSGESKC